MDQRFVKKEGENERVEFKESVTKDIHKEVCAFANLHGGLILIGIDDKGNIVGVDTKKGRKDITAQLLTIEPHLKVRVEEMEIDKKKIIILHIPKSKYLCSVGGMVYIRVGTSKRPLSLQEILFQSVERVITTMDRNPTGISLDEIDMNAVNYFMKERVKRGLEEKDYRELFEKLGIIIKKNGNLVFSFAGALFFVKNPQEYFPFTYIRVKRGEEWKRIGGNIFSQIDSVMSEIENFLSRKSVVLREKRIDIPDFPLPALREAVINAVIHRNYAIESEVFVILEENKISIENPGSFPPGVTPENPKPLPRNPLLYDVAFQSGLVEKEGEGIRKIFSMVKEYGLEAKYTGYENFLKLEIYRPERLTERKEKILALLRERPLSSSEISSVLKISKVTVLEDLKDLMNIGVVEQTGKGKAIKYRLKNA